MPNQRESLNNEAVNSGGQNFSPEMVEFPFSTSSASYHTCNQATPSRQDARYLSPYLLSNSRGLTGQFGQSNDSFAPETPQVSALSRYENPWVSPVEQLAATDPFTIGPNPQQQGFGANLGKENPFGFATQIGCSAASTAEQTFNPIHWGQNRSLPQDVPAKRPASPANKSTRARPTIYKSTEYEFAGPDDPENTKPRPLGRGADSGKNKMAYFGDEEEPGLRFAILVERGRTGKDANIRYPDSKEPLPRGLSLSEVCKRYPNHVWGTMLRVFLCESWNGEKIWKELPTDCRRQSARTRYWNYIQQAIGREIDEMNLEDTGKKRTPQKRKRGNGEENEEENDTGSGNGQILVNKSHEGTGNPLISGITHHASSSSSILSRLPERRHPALTTYNEGTGNPLISGNTHYYHPSFSLQHPERRHTTLNTYSEGTGNPLIPGRVHHRTDPTHLFSSQSSVSRPLTLEMLKEQCQLQIYGQKQNLRLCMQNDEPVFCSLSLEEQGERVQARWKARLARVLDYTRTYFNCDFIEVNVNNPLPLMKHVFNLTRTDPEPLADGPQACRVWHSKAVAGSWECYQKVLVKLSNSISQEWTEKACKAASTRRPAIAQPAIQTGMNNLVQNSTWRSDGDPFFSSNPPPCHNPLPFSMPTITPATTGDEVQMSNTDNAAMQPQLPSLAVDDGMDYTTFLSSPDIFTPESTHDPNLPFGEDPNFRFPWDEA